MSGSSAARRLANREWHHKQRAKGVCHRCGLSIPPERGDSWECGRPECNEHYNARARQRAAAVRESTCS